MKIKPEHYEVLKTQIQSLAAKVPAHRENLKSDTRVKDLEKRLRWDCLHAAVNSAWVCDYLYPYLNDTHIDTALRSIMSELGLGESPTVATA